MASRFVSQLPRVFHARTNYLYAVLTLFLATGMCSLQVYRNGPEALLQNCWGWYLLAFVGSYCLLVPRVRVELNEVHIINPYRSHRISLSALTGLSAHYYLLLEGKKKYRALGAPGESGRGLKMQLELAHDEALTAMTYRGNALKNKGTSGLAAEAGQLILDRWQEAKEQGEIHQIPAHEKSRTNWLALGLTLALGILWLGSLL